jgi:hypothetical protein
MPNNLRLRGTNGITKVEVVGGLGNQLFCLAFAFQYAESNKLPVIAWTLNPDHETRSARAVGIEFGRFPTTTGNPVSFVPALSYLRRLHSIRGSSRVIRYLLPRVLLNKKNRYSSPVLGTDHKALNLPSGKLIRGYFQSDFHASIGLSSGLKELMDKRLDRISQELDQKLHDMAQECIFLHIRGGDYLTHQDSFGNLDDFYYTAALREARNRVGAFKFLVSTDDPVHALKILESLGLEASEYVLLNQHLNPLQVMSLARKCKAHIIANSSFSWWTAKLAVGSHLVICPQPWFKNLQNSDIYPKNWLKLAANYD